MMITNEFMRDRFPDLGDPLPPVQCRPWCEYQDGHPGHYFAADQSCYSPELRVPLSLEPQVEWPGDEDWVPSWYYVYACQEPGEPVSVHVGHNEKPQVRLTPAEARQLVENLQLVLGQIGGAE